MKLGSGYLGAHYTILSTSVYFEIFPNKKFQFQKEKKKFTASTFAPDMPAIAGSAELLPWVVYSIKARGNSLPWDFPHAVEMDRTSLAHTFSPWESEKYCPSGSWCSMWLWIWVWSQPDTFPSLSHCTSVFYCRKYSSFIFRVQSHQDISGEISGYDELGQYSLIHTVFSVCRVTFHYQRVSLNYIFKCLGFVSFFMFFS